MEGFSCGCYGEGDAVFEEYSMEVGDGGSGWRGAYEVSCVADRRAGVNSCVLVYEEDFVDSGMQSLQYVSLQGGRGRQTDAGVTG